MNELDLFAAALAVDDPAQRAALLDRECQGHPELRARIDALLAAAAASHSPVDQPVVMSERTGEFLSQLPEKQGLTRSYLGPGEQVGAVIAGKYTLVEVIGEGGMGRVWRAKQTEPVRRFVAVKLIKAGMDSKQVLVRFDAERQALALMDHPNIAKVLDGGLHEQRPFFVMELVKGAPITEYCDANKLTPLQRLELFVPVCQAIQHAHQKGIIHRDIKPSNVLVALYDDQPVVKVIDFGVAKATGGTLTESTIDTGFGGVVGTPQYMSPEQATFNNLDIDTRSDIYALGVLLYELLTGTPPFSRPDLEKKGFLEMLRVVRDEEPPRPSTKLSTADALPSISANRSTEPKKLTGLLRNELDWIVMKALEKDRARRYETANAFAGDVLRYIAGEPVVAHPPSAAYRLQKFVRRNQLQVIAASLVLLALLVGVIGTTLGFLEARRQEAHARRQERLAKEEAAAKELARQEEARHRTIAESNEQKAREAAEKERLARQEEERQRMFAEGISRFVVDDFLALTSVEGQDRFGGAGREALNKDTKLQELLDRAAEKLRARQDLDPRIEAELCWIVGVNYRGLGAAARGVLFLERAVELRRRVLGAHDPATLDAMNSLAVCYAAAGKPDLALPLQDETLRLQQATLGPDHPNTLSSMLNLGIDYLHAGQPDKALPLFQESLRLQLATLGPDHPSTLESMANLAMAYRKAGQLDKALPLLEETLRLRTATLGPDHRGTLTSMNNLALGYQTSGQLDKAVPLFEETLRLRQAKLGPDHPDTLNSLTNLGNGYVAAGEYDKALPLLEESLRLAQAKLGPDHPETVESMSSLARGYWAAGQRDKALPLFEETLTVRKATLGLDHPQTLDSMGNVAAAYTDAGQLDKALPLSEETLTLKKAKLGPDHPQTLISMGNLAVTYEADRQYAKAEQLHRERLRIAKQKSGGESPVYAGALAQLGRNLLEQKKWAEAEPVLRELLAIREQTEPDNWSKFNAQSMLGGALLGQQKYADAEPLLVQGYGGLNAREKTIPYQGKIRITEAVERLIALYTATNKPDEVQQWQAERAKYPTSKPPEKK